MDRATNQVIEMILAAQARGEETLSLPGEQASTLLLSEGGWTNVILAKAKRHFLAYLRVRAGGANATDNRTTEAEASGLFLRFLGNEAHRSAFLT